MWVPHLVLGQHWMPATAPSQSPQPAPLAAAAVQRQAKTPSQPQLLQARIGASTRSAVYNSALRVGLAQAWLQGKSGSCVLFMCQQLPLQAVTLRLCFTACMMG
jgi:anti-sigma factor RsiW